MTQSERLNYLINIFLKESDKYNNLNAGNSEKDKKALLRSLMNIRMPKTMSEDVLKIQNEYLRNEILETGIVKLDDIPTIDKKYGSKIKFANKISLWQGDITRLETDAIVNAANSKMLGCFIPLHNCIDNCIHSYAGIQMREECNIYMNSQKEIFGQNYEEPTGQAVLTNAYNLPAKFVIHTVGPIVNNKLTNNLKNNLKNCYISVLKCCEKNHLKSVVFCCISTGIFRFPNAEAAKIAIDTVIEFLDKNNSQLERVVFNVFKNLDKECYKKELISRC